jgi:hypothetical protein
MFDPPDILNAILHISIRQNEYESVKNIGGVKPWSQALISNYAERSAVLFAQPRSS